MQDGAQRGPGEREYDHNMDANISENSATVLIVWIAPPLVGADRTPP